MPSSLNLFPFGFGPDSLVYSITSQEAVSKVGRNEFEWGMGGEVKNKLMLVKVVETSNCFLQWHAIGGELAEQI
jgi:hypothetical protein